MIPLMEHLKNGNKISYREHSMDFNVR